MSRIYVVYSVALLSSLAVAAACWLIGEQKAASFVLGGIFASSVIVALVHVLGIIKGVTHHEIDPATGRKLRRDRRYETR